MPNRARVVVKVGTANARIVPKLKNGNAGAFHCLGKSNDPFGSYVVAGDAQAIIRCHQKSSSKFMNSHITTHTKSG